MICPRVTLSPSLTNNWARVPFPPWVLGAETLITCPSGSNRPNAVTALITSGLTTDFSPSVTAEGCFAWANIPA